MQALYKPTPGGGMRLTQVLPDCPCEDMPDGTMTAKARREARRKNNVPSNVADGRRCVPSTIGRFE